MSRINQYHYFQKFLFSCFLISRLLSLLLFCLILQGIPLGSLIIYLQLGHILQSYLGSTNQIFSHQQFFPFVYLSWTAWQISCFLFFVFLQLKIHLIWHSRTQPQFPKFASLLAICIIHHFLSFSCDTIFLVFMVPNFYFYLLIRVLSKIFLNLLLMKKLLLRLHEDFGLQCRLI